MNYWLHRISHHAELSRPLLDKGYLSIGFSDFSNDEFLNHTLEGNKPFFDQQFQDYWGLIPRTRQNLWRFLFFLKNDLVLIPEKGAFTICEIIDDRPLLIQELDATGLKTWDGKPVFPDGTLLCTSHGTRFDLGFLRKIKILYRAIPRDKFAGAELTARMKIRQTNASINDLRTQVDRAVQFFNENKPIDLHATLLEKTQGLVLESITKELNPQKFERLIASYFTKIGANGVTIPPKNTKDKEGDADIVAVFENLKLIVYTQAKFQKDRISETGINQILDYRDSQERLDDGYTKVPWVISTADSFSDLAQKNAQQNQIQLINGKEFSAMLLNCGIDFLRV